MRLGKLKYILSLLKENNLISAQQSESIFQFMNERRRIHFFRLIQWCFVIGGFWIVFGFLALIKLINFGFLIKILNILKEVTRPFFEFMAKVFGENYPLIIYAAIGLAVWALFFWLGSRVRRRESISEFKLNYFQDSRLRSTTVFFVISYIAAGICFTFLNRALLPQGVFYYWSAQKFIPFFYMAAVPFFSYCAYRLKDEIALLFGIYFTALSVGCFSAYGSACYYLAVSRPVLQLLIAIILILVGFLHQANEAYGWKEYFGRTYQWTGLLLGFLALWVMSIWGISKPEGYRWEPIAAELWFANISFIAVAIGCMLFGAHKEERLFFNYGLTFLIIETYTIFFSHLWGNLGVACASLVLGCLLVGTAYLLRRIWLSKQISITRLAAQKS